MLGEMPVDMPGNLCISLVGVENKFVHRETLYDAGEFSFPGCWQIASQ
jgi:hypothetical protein